MPITSPTLVPRPPTIPLVLPRAPQVNPTPLPKLDRYPGRMDTRRDLQREIDDLSDEENELEDSNLVIRNRGFQWLVPIGRHTTQLEEKNEAEDDSDGSDTGQSGGGPSINEDGEENDDSGADLDASMEDMDEEGETGTASEAEDLNDMTDDFEERSSDA
ncbi:uncharacterized protein EDB93DRAFT_1339687 [Suillus bovinus]|uniref:uncharacterized protein n=1 Tax=Suillus bovinus TaxID=48563 RepID=UPI001B8733EB|nr:uncharacterized protein EDB93DRAFT_1339687 [Suillus bovinus]KAG2135233.1 hypothetical protein EDB93DRAFT_1339687 [Suillus bovinus]